MKRFLNRHIKIHAPRIERCTMTFDGPGENQAVEELIERQNGSGFASSGQTAANDV